MDQSNLFKNLVKLNNKSKPRKIESKDKTKDSYESAYTLTGPLFMKVEN